MAATHYSVVSVRIMLWSRGSRQRSASRSTSALALMLFMLTACVSVNGPSARRAEMKRIGVISVAANEFYRHHTGYTLLSSESEKMDISAWRVDDEYELQMARVLGNDPGFEVVRMQYARADLLDLYASAQGSTPAFYGETWERARDKLRALATANGVDALVLFVRRQSEDFLAGTNQLLTGAGFYTNGTLVGNRVSVLYLMGAVALIDGGTGRPLASKVLARDQQGRAATLVRSAPMFIVAPELTRTKLADLGDARLADLRRWLIAVPADSWGPTLRALLEEGSD